MLKSLAIAAVLLSVSAAADGCGKPQPTPPDASVSGNTFCEHLADIGCVQPPECAIVYDQDKTLVDFHTGCIMASTTVAAAEACKSVECIIVTSAKDAGPQ